MEVITSVTPLFAIGVSTVAAFLILLSKEHPNLREFWTIAAGVAKFALVVSMLPAVLEGNMIEYEILPLAEGVSLKLRVDNFGLFFALIASCLWIGTSFYSIGYMRGLKEHAQTRYFTFFALCLSATIGVATAANLLTFFVFYEMLTICTYPLVIHMEDTEAKNAGRLYLTYTLTAGVFLLAGLIAIYSIAGTLEFTPGGFLQAYAGEYKTALTVIFVMMMIGTAVKSGIMPFHAWLPTAMVAPTPVSALLHAVAVVKSGVFGSLRLFWFVFGSTLMHELDVSLTVALAAGFTILTASIVALVQDNLKKRLAYSTISQLSYIILGGALLTESSMMGGALHIVNHAFMKITLFFCAGAIYVNTHRKQISQLDGLGRKMPFTFGAFTIGALGMAGIPPVAGFVSKWFLCVGALEAKEMVYLYALLASSLLNAGYFFPIVYRAFFKKPKPDDDVKGEASPFMVVPICFTACVSILLFFEPNFPLHFFDLARTAVAQVAQGGW